VGIEDDFAGIQSKHSYRWGILRLKSVALGAIVKRCTRKYMEMRYGGHLSSFQNDSAKRCCTKEMNEVELLRKKRFHRKRLQIRFELGDNHTLVRKTFGHQTLNARGTIRLFCVALHASGMELRITRGRR
jgi:hypothetical protein